MTVVLVAETLYTPDEMRGPVGIELREGRISAVSHDLDALRRSADGIVDLGPSRVTPGYVDLHTHGFAGYDVTGGTESDLAAMAAALPATGVTALFPTIASTSAGETLQQVKRIARLMPEPDPHAAEILGIRLEGPFINPLKKGAQYEAAIRSPDPEELRRLASAGPVRIVDFAAERDHDFALLDALHALGILACLGHTEASYDQAVAAIDRGVRHCTHLFNAMPRLEHRAPGAAGAFLTDTRASVEVIADGVHVHPAVLRLVLAARGSVSVALVTDAISAAGLPEGEYSFVQRPIEVRNGAVRLADGTLAGSVLTLDRAVRNMVDLVGASWSEAIRMATLTPAQIAGVADRKGRIAPGADADLLVLDEHGAVQQTWRAGELVYAC